MRTKSKTIGERGGNRFVYINKLHYHPRSVQHSPGCGVGWGEGGGGDKGCWGVGVRGGGKGVIKGGWGWGGVGGGEKGVIKGGGGDGRGEGC